MIDTKVTVSPLELLPELELRRNTHSQRGASTGWTSADEFMSLKKGYPLMIAGLGGSGKTEFTFDLAVNASILHGWKWLVLSPEIGTAEEIIEFLVLKLAEGKRLEKRFDNALTDDEFKKIVNWIHKHFRILDRFMGWNDVFAELDLNLRNLFDVVEREEKILRGSFDGLIIDPFNELDIDIGSNIAGQVKSELDILIRWAKKKNYLPILTNHANARPEFRDKSNAGLTYLWTPPARKEDWAYGQQFGRKGYQMILVHEPHKYQQQDAADDGDTVMQHSCANEQNVRQILVQKTKPKGVGKTGSFFLFYDRKLQRYYEIDSIGVKKWPKYPEL